MNFLASWWTFWHHDEFVLHHDKLFNVMTNFLTSWRFLMSYNKLFDVMKCCLQTFWPHDVFLRSWTFWRHDEHIDIFLMSWWTFWYRVFVTSWWMFWCHHNPNPNPHDMLLMSWWTFLNSWWTFWIHDQLFKNFLTHFDVMIKFLDVLT